ncbi:hypothetical protein KUV47_20085 [Vannielia litorea]|uniref:hypothetical protein n=1 Tax=Vannielia TaxID=2813041 RepID=UPI001C93B78B|nr:hypothetical protein [Vannielia litorea]MBY6049815.1 hypothetical protein [Vannielia litorea]MBY6077229.1 hypothetical protein [Vannielia litorea]MBY6155529.1 hypothetical protein [Vannielia litorea]
MPFTGPQIDHVIYDPAMRRFEADVSFTTGTPLRRKVHVSIPGHVQWGHQKMVSELVAAGERALQAR